MKFLRVRDRYRRSKALYAEVAALREGGALDFSDERVLELSALGNRLNAEQAYEIAHHDQQLRLRRAVDPFFELDRTFERTVSGPSRFPGYKAGSR